MDDNITTIFVMAPAVIFLTPDVVFPAFDGHVSPHAIALPILSLISIVLLLCPLCLFYSKRSIGGISLISNLILLNAITFLNAVIWPSADYASWFVGYGFCDVQVKLQWPSTTAVACALLCITRSLANVLAPDFHAVNPSARWLRHQSLVNCAICYLVPVLQLVIHYVVQVNRYYITPVGGCQQSFDNSWPTILFFFIWPLLFTLISAFYSIAVIARMHTHRATFAEVLSTSRFSPSSFLRLLLMSMTLLLIYTPMTIYFFYLNMNIAWLPYDWAVVHDPTYWPLIAFLPLSGARALDHYVPVAMSLFVFAYFGFAADACALYRRVARMLCLRRWVAAEPRHRQRGGSTATEAPRRLWKLSVVAWARRKLEARGGGGGGGGAGNAVGTQMSTETASSTDKPVLSFVEHLQWRPLQSPPSSRRGLFGRWMKPAVGAQEDVELRGFPFAGRSRVETRVWARSASEATEGPGEDDAVVRVKTVIEREEV